MNFYDYLKVTLGTRLFLMPAWQKMLLFFGFYFILLNVYSFGIADCMNESDIIKRMSETISRLADQNLKLQEELDSVVAQNQMLEKQLQEFGTSLTSERLQTADLMQKQQQDAAMASFQEAVVKQRQDELIVALMQGEQELYTENRSLAGELAEAHQDMGEMASNNIELRIEKEESKTSARLRDQAHENERKEMEETIDELAKQLNDTLKRKKR